MVLSAALHILIILLGISLLIGIHELGHFLVAKAFGIKILRFSIGFGKALWSKRTKSGLEIVFAAIPLGGYVKMLDEREGSVAEKDLPFAFNRQSLAKRAAVIAAGPVANFFLAWLLFCLSLQMGLTQLKPLLAQPLPHSIAAKANLPADSQILKVDGFDVASWSDTVISLLLHYGKQDPLLLQLKSGDKLSEHRLNVQEWTLDSLQPDPFTSLGLVPKIATLAELKANKSLYLEHLQYPPGKAAKAAWQKTARYLNFNFFMTYKLLTGIISIKSLTGPIGIFKGLKFAVSEGLASYLQMLAILSIAIGFINLFPWPGLDGGHLLLICLEFVRRRPLSVAVEVLIYRLSVILLALLMVQALLNDLLRVSLGK